MTWAKNNTTSIGRWARPGRAKPRRSPGFASHASVLLLVLTPLGACTGALQEAPFGSVSSVPASRVADTLIPVDLDASRKSGLTVDESSGFQDTATAQADNDLPAQAVPTHRLPVPRPPHLANPSREPTKNTDLITSSISGQTTAAPSQSGNLPQQQRAEPNVQQTAATRTLAQIARSNQDSMSALGALYVRQQRRARPSLSRTPDTAGALAPPTAPRRTFLGHLAPRLRREVLIKIVDEARQDNATTFALTAQKPRHKVALLHRGITGSGYMRAASAKVNTRCFKPKLKRILAQIKRRFGRPVTVTSGYRTRAYNRRIGGALASQHIRCNAADIKIAGVSRSALAKYIRTIKGVGGVGVYCGRGIVHVDIGPRRSWYHGCRARRRLARRN